MQGEKLYFHLNLADLAMGLHGTPRSDKHAPEVSMS